MADTALDRLIHRPPARFLSRLLAQTPVRPNHVTLFTLVPALISAYFFYEGDVSGTLAGLLFFYGWAVMDHTDGELARFTGQSSAFGQKLDDGCDDVADTLIHAGIFMGLVVRTHVTPLGFWVFLVSAALLVNAAACKLLLRAKRKRRAETAAKNEVGDSFLESQRILDQLSGRDLFYVLILVVLAGYLAGGLWPFYVLIGSLAAQGAADLGYVAAWLKLRG